MAVRSRLAGYSPCPEEIAMTTNPHFTARPSAGEPDLRRMYDLAAAARADALHVADLPWRLASPSARMPERTRLWEDASGNLIAWAVLQFPWHCLDYVVHRDARSTGLEATVLAWACAFLEAEAADRDGGLPFYVSAREGDIERIAAVERAGFVRDNWAYVHLTRDLDRPIPEPNPPPGIIIRPLAGERDVEAYVATHRAAFGSTNMTVAWRLTTLRQPWHTPELDLVAVAPDGTLAGFCVCWITPPLAEGRVAQVEPLGILPGYRRQGLGRALLLEALRRARSLGATHMEVNAESYNDASRRAYTSVGFRLAYETPFYRQTFG
jgi:mycothiol synthase